jgi:DNA-binding MarR family transcriptional regulator
LHAAERRSGTRVHGIRSSAFTIIGYADDQRTVAFIGMSAADERPGIAAPEQGAADPISLPTGARESLGLLLVQLKGGLGSWAAPAFARLGLGHPRQAMLLTVLAADTQWRSLQELGKRVRMDPTTMVATVDALEQRGAVKRVRNPTDRRAYLVQLTDEGRRLAAEADRVSRELEDAFLEPLDPDEREQLMRLLARLADKHGSLPAGISPS